MKYTSEIRQYYNNPMKLAVSIILLMISAFLIYGCDGRQLPDPESKAKIRYEEIEKEYASKLSELREILNQGELDAEDVAELDREFRIRLEEFVHEYKGTEAAAGVVIGFALQDIQDGEFASAEVRLDELIAGLDRGQILALALIHKSVLEADRDLEAALELARQAEKIERIDPGTLFEAQVQRMKLLEWLRHDQEFEALYLKLSGAGGGRLMPQLALSRLHYFLRHDNLDAVAGLIDSVQGLVPEDMILMLKAEVGAYALIGKPAPDISGRTMDGFEFDLAKLGGKVVLITFFSTSAPDIKRHIPRLNRIHEEYSEAGVELIGVCLDDNDENLLPFIAAYDITWPVILDTDMEIQMAYRVYRDPKFYLRNQDGNMASQSLEGVLLENMIIELLGISSGEQE